MSRTYLKNDIKLLQYRDNQPITRRFTIHGQVQSGLKDYGADTALTVKEGASVICYRASCHDSGIGTLREFYPDNGMDFMRDTCGQLVCCASEFEQDQFHRSVEAYLAPFLLLLDMARQEESTILSTFIPPFEIYYGMPESGPCTVYIWVPQPEVETFDKICLDIRQHPKTHPESKLFTALDAILSLTRCVAALHRAKLIHRDITPSNFGFIKRDDSTLTQALCLFDVNSVCSVYRSVIPTVGSDGFTEPEAGTDIANVRSDVYSIGAVLFSAVVVGQGSRPDKLGFYERDTAHIADMVNGSELITASERNSHPKLRALLIHILNRCLCGRSERYENCEELAADLEKALFYVLPNRMTDFIRDGQKWVLADITEELNREVCRDTTLALQYHIYEHPLYEGTAQDAASINVLVLGFGMFGQRFTDLCLQAGQMRNRRLNIRVYSDEQSDSDFYLSERPMLGQFFDINGQVCHEDSYGAVSFQVENLDGSALPGTVSALFTEQNADMRPNYIFIALGDNDLNRNVARSIRSISGDNCSIHYVYEGDAAVPAAEDIVFPVPVSIYVTGLPWYRQVEQMAFNIHLLWEYRLHIPYSALRSKFNKPYNRDSCISSLLSIKSQLYSLNIDMTKCGPAEAAAVFYENYLQKKNEQVISEMAWVEHRRWTAEKLAAGWTLIDDLTRCTGGKTQDKIRKQHIAILHSRPDRLLEEQFGKREKWDTASDAELSRLDDLDRLSVMLHREYCRQRSLSTARDLLKNDIFSSVSKMIAACPTAVSTFSEWRACLANLARGKVDKNDIGVYDSLKNAFQETIRDFPEDIRDVLQEEINNIDTMYGPFKRALEYTDWKKKDEDIIRGIPFILSYPQDLCLAVPFNMECTACPSAVIENAAPVIALAPACVLYICELHNGLRDMSKLLSAVSVMSVFMDKKVLRAEVNLVLLVHGSSMSADECRKQEQLLRNASGGRVRHVKFITYTERAEKRVGLNQYLKNRRMRRPNTAVVLPPRYDGILETVICADGIPYCQYNPYDRTFSEITSFPLPRYIPYVKQMNAPYITVSDLAACSVSTGTGNHPEFYEYYKDLWKLYDQNPRVWKSLCSVLSEYSQAGDTLAVFWSKSKSAPYQTKKYLLPSECRPCVKRILDFLTDKGFLTSDSSVYSVTEDACELKAVGSAQTLKSLNRLLSDIYVLMRDRDIELVLDTNTGDVRIIFNNLSVKNIVFTDDYKGRNMLRLLLDFTEIGFLLLNDAHHPDGIKPNVPFSFSYATNSIKRLLTNAGNILEIYTYHKARETGRFDSIETGFEITWSDTECKNEFDLILTQGFRTLFVECKARPELEQDFYFKIDSLTRRFGANATAVLIADTREDVEAGPSEVNQMQMDRAKQINIVTVWKRDDIANIGNTLLSIAKGNYNNKNTTK